MDERIGLDMRIDPKDSTDGQLRTLAVGMAKLYEDAARRWSGRKLSQRYSSKDGVFTVELSPWPAEMQAVIDV